jgi:hypothetical protein
MAAFAQRDLWELLVTHSGDRLEDVSAIKKLLIILPGSMSNCTGLLCQSVCS